MQAHPLGVSRTDHTLPIGIVLIRASKRLGWKGRKQSGLDQFMER